VPIEAVVADANVLLSAIVGKAALRVFTEYGVTVHATGFSVSEVEEYLPRLAAKYRLPEDLVQLQWRLLPVIRHAEAEYASRLPAALERLRERDAEDAHALALAWALGLPLWSNDRDFEGLDIERYSTAALLRALARERA
jgi:predicted nucleic acid-binding protein